MDVEKRKEIFRENLKAILDYFNITHAELASELGCTRQHVSGLVCGCTAKFTTIQYLAICYVLEKVYKCSKDDIETFSTKLVKCNKTITASC